MISLAGFLPDWAIFRWLGIIGIFLLGAVVWSLSSFPSTITRVIYVAGLFLMTVVAWGLRNFGQDYIPDFFGVCQTECFAFLAVFRVTLGFAIYHLALCMFTIGVRSSTSERGRIHNGFWLAKTIVLLGIITGLFFADPSFFEVYAVISFVGAVVFILVQAVILLDLACSLAEYSQAKYGDGESREWAAIIWISTIFSYMTVIVGSAAAFIYFPGTTLVPTIVNLVLVIVCAVSSVTPCVRDCNPLSGILTSGLIGLLTTYFALSAVGSWPSPDVNSPIYQAMFYIGLVGIFVLLTATAFSTRQGSISLSLDDEDETPDYSYAGYHAVMMLSCFFVCELLVNWSFISTGTIEDGEEFSVGQGVTAFWTKAVSSWLISLLYLFTLYAPVVFDSFYTSSFTFSV